MTVLYGPDGKPITKQTAVSPDLARAHETAMSTAGNRAAAVHEVMAIQMRAAKDRSQLYDLIKRHDPRVTLEASDSHGDQQVLFNGKPVKLKIHKDVAKDMGYYDPTDGKIPHYQEDL